MKKQLFMLLIGIFCISSLQAGSGSFWGGFGLGTATGIVGSGIAHHSHYCPQPRYVEVHTVPVQSNSRASLHSEIRSLERENNALSQENEDLSEKIDKLQSKLSSERKENRKLEKRIDRLNREVKRFESSSKKSL